MFIPKEVNFQKNCYESKEKGILQRQDRIQSILGKEKTSPYRNAGMSLVRHLHLDKAGAEL